ncbi:MAG: endonuclease/exonuclease/phosphatase family protein [Granulosicoccus sp.]
MDIISWNIQAAKGVDDVVSVDRIANDLKAMGDADIICLQEVLVTAETHQVEELCLHFAQHTPVFGAAIDRLDTAGRLKFGNLVLCRLPLLQIVHHKLPQPAEPSVKHMPRQAIEVIVDLKGTPLRVVTTHLDYFAAGQRSAQVSYLAAHHMECIQRYQQPSPAGGDGQFKSVPETDLSIYCGDFNLPVDSLDYQIMHVNSNPETDDALVDCWTHLHGTKPHLPTCGIYDHKQWEEGPHCRDFFFASRKIARIVTAIEVDTETAASDHQPLKLTLG